MTSVILKLLVLSFGCLGSHSRHFEGLWEYFLQIWDPLARFWEPLCPPTVAIEPAVSQRHFLAPRVDQSVALHASGVPKTVIFDQGR